MSIRNCKVTIRDREGIDHVADVTSETLFEAVALGISAIRSDEWTTDIPQGMNCVQVQVTNVPVKHEVRMRDFLAWPERTSGSPHELSYPQGSFGAWWFYGSRPRWWQKVDAVMNLPRWRRRCDSLQRWLKERLRPFQSELGASHSGSIKHKLCKGGEG